MLADGADEEGQCHARRIVFAHRGAVNLSFELEMRLGAVEEHLADLFDAKESQIAVEVLELRLWPVHGLEARAAVLALLDIEMLQCDDGAPASRQVLAEQEQDFARIAARLHPQQHIDVGGHDRLAGGDVLHVVEIVGK